METNPQNQPVPLESAQSTERLIQHFRSQQNLAIAVVAGLGAAVVTAFLWATITVATSYQIGWMAVGVGFAVAMAVRLGKGVDPIYKYLGAGLALFGCILGNALSLIGFIARHENIDVVRLLGMLDFSKLPSLMMETASPMDALFYGLALYQGFKLSTRSIGPEDVTAANDQISGGLGM